MFIGGAARPFADVVCEESQNRFGTSVAVPRFSRNKTIRTTRARKSPAADGRRFMTEILPGFGWRRSCT
jgi:hypothetical protein